MHEFTLHTVIYSVSRFEEFKILLKSMLIFKKSFGVFCLIPCPRVGDRAGKSFGSMQINI